MSAFWAWFVAIVSIINILACWWLIRWTSKPRAGEAQLGDTTGHIWDGDLTEYNNPMPRWWLWMFYICIIFGLIYLALYPGLGNYKGWLNWTQEGQYASEVQATEQKIKPLFAQYSQQDIATLSEDSDALKIGQRLFSNYCSTCHGSDAKGSPGFPNLADQDWLYGGTPEAIKASILNGRQGMMPALGSALGDDVAEVANYVLSLSVSNLLNPSELAAGKQKFTQVCAACHQVDGSGNPALGAPNLADNIWLYGGSREAITQSILQGRQGIMPAHEDFLGADKVHLLTAYVYSLSRKR